MERNLADAVIGALRVVLGADSAAFEKQMNDVAGKLQSFGAKIAGIGAGLTAGLTLPLVALGKKAFGAFEESEKAIAKLEAALKSTGGTVGFTSDKLQEMAAQLQKITTFDDDDILGNVTSTLLRFGEVSGSIFKDAQIAVLDVAAAMKIGLAEAATLVGKALQDPAKAFGTLRKAGISFTEAQKKIIEQMVKTGRVAEAQKLILQGLTDAFGGQAEALAGTAEGKWTQALNAIGDALEDVGKVIAPFVVKVADFIKSLAEAFHALDPAVQQFIVYSLAAAAALGPLLIALGAVVGAVGAIGIPVAAVIIGVGALLALLFSIGPGFEELGSNASKSLGPIETALGFIKKEFDIFLKQDLPQAAAELGKLFTQFQLFLIDTGKLVEIFGLNFQKLAVIVQIWALQLGGWFKTVWLEAQIMAVQVQLAFVGFTITLLEAAKAISEFAVNVKDTAFDAVQTKFEQLGTIISTAAAKIKTALDNAKSGFTNLSTEGVRVMTGVAKAAKEWLEIALGNAIDYVIKKISELIKKFKDMYDKVVGNSYIPDMVSESNAAIKDMSRTMLDTTEKMVDGTNALFSKINSPSMAMGEVTATKTIVGELADSGGQGQVLQPAQYFNATFKIDGDTTTWVQSKQQIIGDLADMFAGARLRVA